METMEYYEAAFQKKWNECLKKAEREIAENDAVGTARNIATQIFEEGRPSAEELAGYYIGMYGDDALKGWHENTEGTGLSENDRAAEKILTELYGTDKETEAEEDVER
jgi:hypothetical protein